jgi:hypothetical protein
MHCPHNRPRCNCQLLRSRYNLEKYLVTYLDNVCPRGDPKGPLFRTIGRGGTRQLTRTMLPQANAYAMIRGRAVGAGIATKLGNYSFRATGITAYLRNGGTLEKGGGAGEPRFDAHDATLRSPTRRAQPR